MPPPLPSEEIAQLMRFVAEKAKNVKSPMSVIGLASQFKEEIGSLISVAGLKKRIVKSRLKIHKMNGFDMNTKVKMIFALSAPIDKGFLNELKKQADVEVDEKRRIKKYQPKDGSLKLEGSHEQSSIHRSTHSDRWQKVCKKANDNESEEEGDEDGNGQRDYEKTRVTLVKFLIEQTKNATFPLNIQHLAKNYKTELKFPESQNCIRHRINDFRQRIHEMNQFDKPTKVRMMFALSASIDDDLLMELQKDAIVELDEQLRIKEYTANDGSLTLKGVHRGWSSRRRAAQANRKKRRVVNVSSESEEEDDEGEDSIETDGSDDESGGDTDDSVRPNQASTSSPKRRSQRIRKSTVYISNMNKRTTTTQKQSSKSKEKKRARISYSPSETSEEEEESTTLENDPSMDSKTSNSDHGGEDFDYDAPINNHTDENLEQNVTDSNSGRNIATPEVTDDVEEEEKKEEESSASSSVKIESMSLLELLTHLRLPILKYSPTLVPRIDENIKQLEKKDKQIPFHCIIESLEMCIQILNTPDEMDPDENTTSLSDFFFHLGMAMCNISHPSMDDFHVKMRKLATTGDEKVSMEHIRYAMGETLDKILH